MHYFLIAGETSGDLHAGQLISALRDADPEARFTFLGGDCMAAAAASDPVVHCRDMAFMGFSEVLRHLGDIRRIMRTARRAILEAKPDCLILIDYPSFNLKMARVAARAGIPVFYYISPKLWAWKKWRIRDIRRLVDRVLCILPFEPEWYRANRYDNAVYVGNPSVEEIERALAQAPARQDFARAHRLRDNRQFLALLPGSRIGEIRCNLPIMDAVARQFPQYTIVVAGAPGIPDEFYKGLTKFSVVRDATHNLLAVSHAALVTSGTATLEAALAGVPQVVTYRSNGSRIAYSLMKRLLHVKHVSLPNLIVGDTIIPEMLLHLCTPEAVTEQLAAICPDNAPAREAQLQGYADMRQRLGGPGAAMRAADIITTRLKELKQ